MYWLGWANYDAKNAEYAFQFSDLQAFPYLNLKTRDQGFSLHCHEARYSILGNCQEFMTSQPRLVVPLIDDDPWVRLSALGFRASILSYITIRDTRFQTVFFHVMFQMIIIDATLIDMLCLYSDPFTLL